MDRHTFDPDILRAYDIRGTVGTTLGRRDAYAVGRGLGTLAHADAGDAARAVVGYDGRLSSPDLAAAVIEGFRDAGVEVTRIGCGPTPMLYYAAHALRADAAVQVTGSHNPPDMNGFKMLRGGKPFFSADIQKLGQDAAAGRWCRGPGRVSDGDLLDRYVAEVADGWDGGARALTVVWDAGHGAAAVALEKLTARLPGRHVLLNATVDGTFPAHHPDPTQPENLTGLIGRVRAEQADLGIAFDGDGDRIGVVDGRGRILWGDQILQILAEDVLAARPGATVIADVKASQVLFDEVARLGGRPVMWKSGHSWIKHKMAETGAVLAGEMSGHVFFADRWYGFDDALYAAVRFLGVVARGAAPLAARVDRLPRRLNTPELRVPCPEGRKFAVVEEVGARLKAAGAEVNGVDGLRVQTAGGWWLLRASNTQALLTARVEADTPERLRAAHAELSRQLALSGIELGPAA